MIDFTVQRKNPDKWIVKTCKYCGKTFEILKSWVKRATENPVLINVHGTRKLKRLNEKVGNIGSGLGFQK